MTLFKDLAYQDMTDEERDRIADRIDDHAPHDAWGSAFPTYTDRTSDAAIRKYQEYRARRDTAPHGQGVQSMPRAA